MLPTNFSIGNPGNGIAEQARQQATALEELGHEVERLNPWNCVRLASFDVIHFFLGGPQMQGIESRILGEAKSRPVFAFSPIIDSNQPHLLYKMAARLGNCIPRFQTIPGVLQNQCERCDLIICRSDEERRRVVKSLSVPEAKVRLVLNGVPVAQVSSSEGDQSKIEGLDLPPDFLLHISAYTQARKNVIRMLDAIELLEIPVVIAGHAEHGSVRRELEKRAESNSNIRLLGFIDAPMKDHLFRACRVFCLPSTHEGTGLAALEAGLAGARVVITKCGGTADYFQNHAVYVDPFDVKSIRSGIKEAWEAPASDRLKMHIRSNLTWETSARTLVQAYLSAERFH